MLQINGISIRKDLTGYKFHRWTVLRLARKQYWLCQCICGVIRQVRVGSLTTGHSKSCGCLASELKADLKLKHGKSRTPEYRVWVDMRRRCSEKNRDDYPMYGGRGIKVCSRWESFINFFNDMGPRPKGMSIDRIDNDKGYSKNNCRWSSLKSYLENRNHKRIKCKETNQEFKNMAEAGRILNIDSTNICRHILKGVPKKVKGLTFIKI